MLLQALSLISGLLLVTGLILTTNFTVAKNVEHQRLSYALQLTSDRALNDAETWARDVIALRSAQGIGTEPLRKGVGSSQLGCVDTSCTWHFIEAWRVTGGTAEARDAGKVSLATNLEPAVGEGRVSLILTTTIYKSLQDPLTALASRTQIITGRTLDLRPFFVTTAVQISNANEIAFSTAEGDSGGVKAGLAATKLDSMPPSVDEPSRYIDTVITSKELCENSNDAQNRNPFLDVPKPNNRPKLPIHSYVPTSESLVWIYEAPCLINFIPFDAPSNFAISQTSEYLNAGSVPTSWRNGNENNASLAK